MPWLAPRMRTIEDTALAGLAASEKLIASVAFETAPAVRQPVRRTFWPAETKDWVSSLGPKAREALRPRCERASVMERSHSPPAAQRWALTKPAMGAVHVVVAAEAPGEDVSALPTER